MNKKAKKMLSLPQRSKSGTAINSMIFIVATTIICVIAFILDLSFVKIQIAIPVSASPMRSVNGREKSFPKIRATISSCRGRRFSTLQKNPLAIHTVAMK